ncbi:endospore germination permease [Paenibacillus sepulcri]|uniref:Spore germination protein n=1 Tax=Paenibacillus sepulcri TaxID=359917 RepID=A0ABS7C4M4_9BACL|nr:spore germination protein [Paenibacillus sepulcri]
MEARQITMVQAAAVIASTIIGVGVLELPRLSVNAMDSGAPLFTLIGALIGLVGLILTTVLGVRFPRKSLIQYSEDIIGRWLALVINMALVVFFSILTALASREFGEVVVTSVLKRTPLEVTVIMMLLLAAVIVRTDIATFTSVHLFYLPFMFVPGIAIVIFSLKNGFALNLLPIWGNEHHQIFSGLLTIAALFQCSFVITLIIPFMRSPKRAYVSMLWGWGISGVLYLLIVIAAVAVFGPEEIKVLMWPTLELAKTTALPANILERLDAAFLAVWVTAVFTTLFSTYYLTIKSITQMFRLRDHKMFSYFLLPFIFLSAMLPQSVLQMYDYIDIVGQTGLILTVGYPCLLLMLAMIRKKRGEENVGSDHQKNL